MMWVVQITGYMLPNYLIFYLFDIGLGPLGTSCLLAPNSLRIDFEEEEVCMVLVSLGCKFTVEVVEESKRNLLLAIERGILGGLVVGFVVALRRRRRKMQKRAKRRSRECDFEKVSERVDDDDDDGVLGSAMQSRKINHPPRDQKGSISMNQHQG
ncbi:hypothetical protein ACOSP7_003423 [Xanthoceras sorbifolium]